MALLCLTATMAFAVLNIPTDSPPPPMKEVWIPGGEFTMGDEESADARPLHTVYVDGFWMDETEVTNEQFAWFIKQTGYADHCRADAAAPRTIPMRRSDRLVAGSGVFNPAQCPPGKGVFGLRQLVGVSRGSKLASSGRTGQRLARPREISRRTYRLGRRTSVCPLGG